MLFRYFGDTKPAEAVCHDCSPVNVKRHTADSSSLQFCAAHASLYAHDNETLLQFCNRSDDDDHCSTQWAAGVNVFPQTHKLNSQMAEFIEHLQKMSHVSGYSVERGDQNNIEAMSAGICKKLVETRTFGFCARNCVRVFMNDFKSALLRQFTKVIKLRFSMLVAS
jgi:hypothetical protein